MSGTRGHVQATFPGGKGACVQGSRKLPTRGAARGLPCYTFPCKSHEPTAGGFPLLKVLLWFSWLLFLRE